MHLRVIEETGFFTADEMLYPSNYQYLVDIAELCCRGRTLGREPGASPGVERHFGTRRHEEPHCRLYHRYAQLHLRRTGAPELHLPQLGGRVRRQSARARRYAWLHRSRWAHLPQLPLRAPGAPGRTLHRHAGYANPAAIIDCNHDNSASVRWSSIAFARKCSTAAAATSPSPSWSRAL